MGSVEHSIRVRISGAPSGALGRRRWRNEGKFFSRSLYPSEVLEFSSEELSSRRETANRRGIGDKRANRFQPSLKSEEHGRNRETTFNARMLLR